MRLFVIPIRGRLLFSFHNLQLFLLQSIQYIHQPVDLCIRRLDLALENFLFLRSPDSRQAAVQLQHAIHQLPDYLRRSHFQSY